MALQARQPSHAASAVIWCGSFRACLDDKGLARNLAQVLPAQQLTCGQHHATACCVFSAKAAMQVQRLACKMPCRLSGCAIEPGLLCRVPAFIGQRLSRIGLMQARLQTCHTGRREALILAVLIEPPAAQQIKNHVIIETTYGLCCKQARLHGPQ